MYHSCPHCYGKNSFQAIFCTYCLEPLRTVSELFGSDDTLKFLMLSQEIQRLPSIKGESSDEKDL